MKIEDSVVVVTGANRGIGAEFVRQFLARGAKKVYAAARDRSTIDTTDPRVVAVTLDVTDAAQIDSVGGDARDATIVVNNAGISSPIPLVTGSLDSVRAEFETNVFGVLQVSRVFAPVLHANGGGAIVNVLSAASWASFPIAANYAATKAAAWSLTDGLRLELSAQGTQVLGLHMGLVDTDMTANHSGVKVTAESVVTAALDALEDGAAEVLADDAASQVKATLTLEPYERYRALAG